MATFDIIQIREGAELYLTPSNDGCNTALTPVGQPSNYLCIDDTRLNPDDDTSYVYSSATDLNYDLYLLPNHTTETGTINYVQVYARAKSHIDAQSQNGIFKIILTDNACGNIYKSNDINLITSYLTYDNIWTTNPRTATTWTWSDIDNLQVGIECSSPTIMGASKLLVIRPNAAGDNTALGNTDGSTFGAATNYTLVDETTSDGDATRVSWIEDAASNPGYDLYNLENHSSETGTITKVSVFVVAKKANAYCTNPFTQPLIKTGGTEYNGTQNMLSTDYVIYSDDWTTNPNTGIAWTWADIDALQAGVRLDSIGAVGCWSYCTQVYVVVYYNENINPEIRTTQVYAKVNYDEEITCSLNKPEKVSFDHRQNIKMLNFWSGNRAVYGLSRAGRSLVLSGTQYGNDSCTNIECVRAMGEAGDEITLSGVGGSSEYDRTFRIISFGWKKISDAPLKMDWILELEYA
jgi:hypothetical protein